MVANTSNIVRLTSVITGHERETNHFTPARMSAPRASHCYVGVPLFGLERKRHAKSHVSLNVRFRVGNPNIVRHASPNTRSGKYVTAKTIGKQNVALSKISG